MTKPIRHVLGEKRFKGAKNQDVLIPIQLSGQKRTLAEETLSFTIDEYEQFERERQASAKYRLHGKFTLLHPEFAGMTETTLLPGSKDSWVLSIGYPSGKMTEVPDIAGTRVTNGIPIQTASVKSRKVNGKIMTSLKTYWPHALNIGDQVRISFAKGGLSGDYEVQALGDEEGEERNFIFVIDALIPKTPTPLGGLMKRLVDGVESEYYWRELSLLTTINDYQIVNSGFEQTIFTDPVYLYNFEKDVDVTGLVDYLGRPLSELYLVTAKRAGSTPVDWSDVWQLPENQVTYTFDDQYFFGSVSLKDGYRSSKTGTFYDRTSVSKYLLDMVDYNSADLSERLVVNMAHVVRAPSTVGWSVDYETKLKAFYKAANNEDGAAEMLANRFHFFYDPFLKIPIRAFSTFIETGDDTTVDIPGYAVQSGAEYRWRDLLDIGVSEEGAGVDYPFMNGAHYLFADKLLYFRNALVCWVENFIEYPKTKIKVNEDEE